MESDVGRIISDYTIEGRKAVGILADIFGLVMYKNRKALCKGERNPIISKEDAYEAIRRGRIVPYSGIKGSQEAIVGKVFGLGVSGYLGSIIEIEAVAFPAQEKKKGSYRFNETAGSMTKDSVFNVASIMRKMTGEDIADYDIHVNVIGGGKIDGPSAGTAIFLAVKSAIENKPIKQNMAVSGEVSIHGRIKAVGGLQEKIYGAKQAGIETVYIPKENEKEIPNDIEGINIVPVNRIEEINEHVFEKGKTQ